MNSNSMKDEVELEKKRNLKEVIKLKHRFVFALLASICFCLTLVVVLLVAGYLFGFYWAKFQLIMLPIEQQNFETVVGNEGNIETDLTTCENEIKLAQQLELKIEDKQLDEISTTTQILTITPTDEDSYQVIITPYRGVLWKITRITIVNSSGSDEIDENQRNLRQFESTTVLTLANPKDLDTKVPNREEKVKNFDQNLKSTVVMSKVFARVSKDKDKEPVSVKTTSQESTTKNTEITQESPEIIENKKLLHQLAYFHQRYSGAARSFLQCQYALAQRCSTASVREKVEAKWRELHSAGTGLPITIHNYNATELLATRHQLMNRSRVALDAAIENIFNIPVALCIYSNIRFTDRFGFDLECDHCVQRTADCYYTFKDTCKSEIEWKIIYYEPKRVYDMGQCVEEIVRDVSLKIY